MDADAPFDSHSRTQKEEVRAMFSRIADGYNTLKETNDRA